MGAGLRLLAIGVAGLVVVQIGLGGGLASSNTGLACAAFPSCNGGAWFPTLRGPMGLAVLHRIVALGLLAGSGLLWALTRGRGSVGRAAAALCLIVTAQGSVGAANVLLGLPVEVTLFHSFGAAAVALTTGWLHAAIWTSPMPRTVAQPSGQVAVEGA